MKNEKSSLTEKLIKKLRGVKDVVNTSSSTGVFEFTEDGRLEQVPETTLIEEHSVKAVIFVPKNNQQEVEPPVQTAISIDKFTSDHPEAVTIDRIEEPDAFPSSVDLVIQGITTPHIVRENIIDPHTGVSVQSIVGVIPDEYGAKIVPLSLTEQ
jgi:hypothetical protein